ncbi:hypothetical protein Brsp01_43940 [Brucella sp. NBRC 12950]|nr:hypothetical protein Brsp01_43940 [Brucella sp. NBRC 12950]
MSFIINWLALWILTFVLAALSIPFGMQEKVLKRFVLLSLPFVLAVFIFHGVLLPQSDFVSIGYLRYSPEGVAHAALLSGRISLMLAASLLFVSSTHPSTLLRSFDGARLPPGVSYLVASPLLLLDEFGARAKAIQDAQRSRGLNTEGSMKARFNALSMLVVPLVTSALSDAHERADVLNARGFRALPYRTTLHPLKDSAVEKQYRRALYLISILQVGYALWR